MSTGQADEVWMIPCWKHPFGKELAPYATRVQMCDLTAAPMTNVHVSGIEGKLKGVSYTVRTLMELMKSHHPLSHEFSVLIGADAYAERDKWKDFDDITRIASVISPGRGDLGSDAPVLSGVSSTQVRRMLKEGRDVSMLLPAAVRNYIMEKGLYRE